MQQPTHGHWQMVKRILQYLHGNINYGIRIASWSSFSLYAFSDADWAGYPKTRRSTRRYCVYLGSNCISWKAKKQPTVSLSSAEAEYRALASTTTEITWVTYILRDIGVFLFWPLVLLSDNISAFFMTVYPFLHARTKHIKIDYYFVHKKKFLLDLLLFTFWSPQTKLQMCLSNHLSKHLSELEWEW